MADKADVLLIGPKKPLMVEQLGAAFNLHMAADAKDFDKFISEVGPRIRGIALSVTTERAPGALMAQLPRLEIVSTFGVGYDHIEVEWAGDARRHRHQHAGCAQRGGRRHRARAAALHRARTAAGGAVPARRQMAGEGLPADAGDLARRDRRSGRHGPDRPGHRAPPRSLPGHRRLSQPQAAIGRGVQALSEARRHGARRRHAAGDRAGRADDAEHDQRRGARCARAGRYLHQHGARLGGRRRGADQGAASEKQILSAGPRCLSATNRRSRRS